MIALACYGFLNTSRQIKFSRTLQAAFISGKLKAQEMAFLRYPSRYPAAD